MIILNILAKLWKLKVSSLDVFKFEILTKQEIILRRKKTKCMYVFKWYIHVYIKLHVNILLADWEKKKWFKNEKRKSLTFLAHRSFVMAINARLQSIGTHLISVWCIQTLISEAELCIKSSIFQSGFSFINDSLVSIDLFFCSMKISIYTSSDNAVQKS